MPWPLAIDAWCQRFHTTPWEFLGLKRPDRHLLHLVAVCIEGKAFANRPTDLKQRTKADDRYRSWLIRPPLRHRRWLKQQEQDNG